jgi:hypothetical protein
MNNNTVQIRRKLRNKVMLRATDNRLRLNDGMLRATCNRLRLNDGMLRATCNRLRLNSGMLHVTCTDPAVISIKNAVNNLKF